MFIWKYFQLWRGLWWHSDVFCTLEKLEDRIWKYWDSLLLESEISQQFYRTCLGANLSFSLINGVSTKCVSIWTFNVTATLSNDTCLPTSHLESSLSNARYNGWDIISGCVLFFNFESPHTLYYETKYNTRCSMKSSPIYTEQLIYICTFCFQKGQISVRPIFGAANKIIFWYRMNSISHFIN